MKTLTALVVITGMSVASGAVMAQDYRERPSEKLTNYELSRQGGRSVDAYGRSRRGPEVRGYLFRPGGHRYDHEWDASKLRDGPYGNFPQFDTRTLWERTMSDPRSTTTSPSAF
jgi:hypothetical protein